MTAFDVEIGPIWDQRDAERKAAAFVENHPGIVWTGGWTTTQPGIMSVINVRVVGKTTLEIGPIRNQEDVEIKARNFIQTHPWLKWTGQWNTRIPNNMLVIEIEPVQSKYLPMLTYSMIISLFALMTFGLLVIGICIPVIPRIRNAASMKLFFYPYL